MSIAPGGTISRQDEAPPSGVATAWSTQFIISETERGPDAPVFVRSIRDYESKLGGRTLAAQATYDEVAKNFDEDGGAIWVMPLRGPAASQQAAYASASFLDSAGLVAMTMRAAQPGAYWNRLSGKVTVTSGTFTVQILSGESVVRTSPAFATVTAAQAWAASPAGGGLVTLTPGAGTTPITTSNAIAAQGGNDDYAGVNLDQIRKAARRFGLDKGPGRYRLPGRSAPEAQLAVADTLSDVQVNRLLSADLPDTSNEAALLAHAALLNAHPNSACIDMFAQRWVYVGLATDSPGILVGPSLGRGAREASNDADGITPNQAAAGPWGKSRKAIGLSRTFDDPDVRARLNAVGINVSIMRDGRPMLFGERTAALPSQRPVAVRIGSARLRLAVIDLLQNQIDATDFAELDPSGIALGNLVARAENIQKRFATSFYLFKVTAELVEGDDPGTYQLNVEVVFQASPSAEVIRAVVTRQITEV